MCLTHCQTNHKLYHKKFCKTKPKPNLLIWIEITSPSFSLSQFFNHNSSQLSLSLSPSWFFNQNWLLRHLGWGSTSAALLLHLCWGIIGDVVAARSVLYLDCWWWRCCCCISTLSRLVLLLLLSLRLLL